LFENSLFENVSIENSSIKNVLTELTTPHSP